MDYTDLRNKTIFDLTNDEHILRVEFGIKRTAKEYAKGLPIDNRISDFIGLAELTNNKELEDEIYKQFAKEFDKWGFE